MYTGGFSEELDDLLEQYKERFTGRPGDGFGTMVLPPEMTHDELVERLRRALDEDKPIDVPLEYYGPKFKESVMRGDILF